MESLATGIFNICSGKRIDLNTLTATISDVLNVDLHPRCEKPKTRDIRYFVSNIMAASTLICYEVRYFLNDGLNETFWAIGSSSGRE